MRRHHSNRNQTSARHHDEVNLKQARSHRASRMTKQLRQQQQLQYGKKSQANSNDLPVQIPGPNRTFYTGCVLVFVIIVPIVLAASALVNTCSAYRLLERAEIVQSGGSAADPFGGVQMLPIESTELMGDQHDQHELLTASELPLPGQADESWLSRQQVAQSLEQQKQQADWGQRLVPGRLDGSQPWPVVEQQFAPQTVRGQLSPLSRAIEATRTFMRQQHQQLANASASLIQSPPVQPATLSALSFASTLGEPSTQQFRLDEALQNPLRLPAPYQTQTNGGSPLQVANKLYNLLFQPKMAGQSLSSSLAQSLVEVRRKMSPQPVGGAAVAGANNQEPFQYASSEDNFRHSDGHREQRSLVTLSAPYEQHQQAAAAAAASNESSPNAEPQYKWQVENLRSVEDETSEEQLPSQQQQRPDQIEVGPANEDETGQQNGTMQWNLSSQEDEQAEIERHQPDQRQHQIEQPEEEQQIVMVSGGEVYEQVSEAQPDSKRLQVHLIGQRPSNATTSAHFFVAANETFDAEQQQAPPPEESAESNSTETEANLQGDESLLAVQLPSQYDSVIGVPPEGHYDDYFKPLGSAGSAQSEQQALPIRGLAQNATGHTQQYSANQLARPESSQAEFVYQFPAGQQDSKRHNQPNGTQPHAFHVVSNLNASSYFPTAELTEAANVSAVDQLTSSAQSNQWPVSSTAAGQKSTGNGEQYRINTARHNQHQQPSANGSSDDGIQLIVANSRDELQDPNTNEKVITYTSENGHDSFARLVGKPARQTFFNKDLNELPVTTRPSNAPVLLNHVATSSRRPTRSPPPLPSQAPVAVSKLVAPNAVPANHPEEVYEMVLEPGELQAPVEPVEQQFGHYAGSLSNRADHKWLAARATAAPSKTVSQTRGQVQDKPNNRHSDNGRRQTAASSQLRNQNNPVPHRNSPHHHNHNQQQQQTIPRPQVTEARFQLKDLPLNAPTESPSLGESTAKAIEELPSRAKRLREADKNELMNELLAALDRVKAAIYKLQPLTAKMNAIYRKSVTSNTRDQILDNHKGTYAKRYPPGDYDDAYDRMHPSEMVANRQQRATTRVGRSSLGNKGAGRASNRLQQQQDSMQARGSQTSAVYLPAPRQVLSSEPSWSTGGNQTSRPIGDPTRPQRRVTNETEPDRSQLSRRSGDLAADGSRAWRLAVDGGSDSSESPMFGYRITIYQSPSDGAESQEGHELGPEAREKQILSYSLIDDGHGQPIEFSSVAGSDGDTAPMVDSMATSESSLVAQVEDEDEETDNSDDEEEPSQMEASESAKAGQFNEKRKKHQKEAKESAEKGAKKAKKAKGKKGGEKHWKQQHKGKKGHEEHKRQKVFKKIKHHKGLMSKESHKLHRDKHIKAHDRGAAKEKALKERTQIEFFEREQIVDDEFEKGKKSTMKAGWASGHDSKKSTSEIGGGHAGGDSMSMGGSQQVDRISLEPANSATSASSLAPMMMLDSAASNEHGQAELSKGKGHSVASSSGKQSNKFEKKHMESRGKKFKGWREKGYKIITETEFIDRGSLHDSAYKKRDKGAAHHQKFKKHEAKSEGHEGKMDEMHKKSQKKEEKSHKSAEKRHELSGKEEEDGKKSGKKGIKKEKEEQEKKEFKKHSNHGDHDQEESALNTRSEPLQGVNKTRTNDQLPLQLITKVLDQIGSRPSKKTDDKNFMRNREKSAVASGQIDSQKVMGSNEKGLKTSANEEVTASERRPKLRPGAGTNSTGSNATLLDIISRLDATRSTDDRKSAGKQLASSASLVRLVNTLAHLNQTQSSPTASNHREQLKRPGSGGDSSSERAPANRVQFDEQLAAQRHWAPASYGNQDEGERRIRSSMVPAPSEHGNRNLQNFGRHSLDAMQLMAEPSERPYFARVPAPNQRQPQSHWPPVEPGAKRPPTSLGLQHQQIHRMDPRQAQQFLYDTTQDAALVFGEPSPVADYDSPAVQLAGVGPANFRQQQQQQPEVVQHPFQMQRHQQLLQQPQLQPFSFLTD